MDYFNGSRAVTRVKAGKAGKQGLYELSRVDAHLLLWHCT